jgi:hypothetical protein
LEPGLANSGDRQGDRNLNESPEPFQFGGQPQPELRLAPFLSAPARRTVAGTDKEDAMATIVVQHRINDPETFFGLTAEVTENAPAGVSPRQFCPSEDRAQAVCLWEAGSVDAVREYLDSIAGTDVTENSYFVIDEEFAFGLPEHAATSA